jgi:hypothetical protein
MASRAVRSVPSWLPLLAAAQHLGESADSLRKKLERAAVKSADGGVEAELDGLRARKLGRLWKVRLSDAWR